jgi:hypothetical protein
MQWRYTCNASRERSYGAPRRRFVEDAPMKLISAIIKPFKLDEVREALNVVGVQASPSPR